MSCRCMKASSDVNSSESDDDSASKPSVLLANDSRSNSANRSGRRAEKVGAVSTDEKQDESQNLEVESNPEPEEKVGADDDDSVSKPSVLLAEESRPKSSNRSSRRAEKVWAVSADLKQEEEKVGDIVSFGKKSYFVVDIFEKEIMELGDKTDLNFKRFNNFEAVSGDAPLDHHFYSYRGRYWSQSCVYASGKVESEWGILKRELASREEKGVSFFVRTYSQRKELMRVAVTVVDSHQKHNLFFFDIKFSSEYPLIAPSFFYHSFGFPLSTTPLMRGKLRYNILDVFLHIEEIMLMNTNKSCQQMLDMLNRPLMGFEDFVKGHFRKKGGLILQNLMKEFDMEKESDKKMFWKMYIAFEDNKSYCEHLLNSDTKKELEKYREDECSLNDHYHFSSQYFPTTISRFDSIKTTKSQNYWSKFLFLG